MVRQGIPAGPAGFGVPGSGAGACAPTTAFAAPVVPRALPSRTIAWTPSAPAGAAPRNRPMSTVASGKILVVAVAAGAVVPAVQAFDVTHTADAGSTTAELGSQQMALAAQSGAGAAAGPSSAGVTSPINDVTTISMSSAAPAAAAPAESDLDNLSKAVSVARENGPLEFGKPYDAGSEKSLDGQISKALGLLGLPQRLAPGVKKIIMKESTGNADAINDWDSNAAAGTPSKGLMQLIDTTFQNSVLPSLADRGIYDPVANITAGVRTMIANHSISDLMDGGLTDSSGNYKGYGGAALPDDGLGRAD